MNIEQLLTEHKKGVKAVKYAKKPTPLIGPEAVKRKEDQKKKPAVKKVEPMSESTDDDEENYYYRVRHQTERDIELEMPPKAWDSVGPKYATYDEAKAAFDELKSKHPNEKFTYTRHPRISYVGGKPSQAFPEDMSESKPKGYDSDGNPLGGGYDEYDNDKKTWTVVVNGKAWKTFDNERQAYNAADSIQRKYGKKTRVVSESIAEGKIKVNIKHPPETAQEKLYKKHQELRKKSGLPDPSEYKKKAAEKQKEIDDMKEAKQPEAPKPRNFVAKNAKTAGAGAHKDKKKAEKQGDVKHKNKALDMAENVMGKVVDYKPGVSATIDTGPGMTTMLDLKKNPTSLTKDPQTGKLKLMPGTAATAQPSATSQSTVKPGDQVEMPKTNTMAAEDILRLAGLR